MPPRKRAAAKTPTKKTSPKKPAAKRPAAKKAATRKPTKKTTTAKRRAPRKKAAPKKATARDLQVLELRRAGVAFDKIAVQLKFTNRDSVHEAYERAIAETLPQPADEVRRLELDRLERLMTPLWPKAMRGDTAAIDRLTRLSEQRTRVAAESSPLLAEPEKVERGPVEKATMHEIRKLHMTDHTLAAAALVMARCTDISSDNSLAASTAARELRQTMTNLRNLAGSEASNNQPKEPSGTVVPESRLAAVRARAEARGASRT